MRRAANKLPLLAPQLTPHFVFKAWYTLFFGSTACLLPYIVLHFQRSGLTPKEIGFLLALQPWTSAPAGFIWSWLADRTRLHKFLLLINLPTSLFLRAAIVLSNCKTCFILLVLLTEITNAPVMAFVDVAAVNSCHQDADYGKLRLWGGVGWGVLSVIAGWIIEHHGIRAALLPYLILAAPCVLLTWSMNTWSSNTATQSLQTSQQGHKDPASDPTTTSADLHAAPHPTRSTSDTQDVLTQDQTQPHTNSTTDRPEDAAAQDKGKAVPSGSRQYKSEGRSTTEDTHVVDSPNRRGHTCEAPGFGSQAEVGEGAGKSKGAVGVGCLGESEQLPVASAKDVESGAVQFAGSCAEGAQAKTGLEGLVELLSDPHVLCFLYLGTLMGYGLGQLGSFLFLLLEELGASKTLMGITLAVTCASEIPVFQLQSFMLQYISLNVLLHIVAWSYVVRLLCYGLLPWWGNPWAVLPVELLHGLTFACAWGLGTVQARRLAHPGLETTMQGLFQGVFFGVGCGLGALVGGVLSDHFGYQFMYFIGAATMLLGYLVYVVLQQLVRLCTAKQRASREYSRVATDEVVRH